MLTPAHQEVPRQQRERRQDAGLVWCAVATYVLIAIVKKELQLDAALYTCLQILSVSVFEKTEVSCALQPDASQIDLLNAPNQLHLFDF